MAIQRNSRKNSNVDNNAERNSRKCVEGVQNSKKESEGASTQKPRGIFLQIGNCPIITNLNMSENKSGTTFEKIAIIFTWIVVVITFPISIFFCYVIIPEYQRAVFFRLGRIRKGAVGPGLIWYLPCIDSYGLVDLRVRVEVIPTQEMMTKDAVTLSVDAVLFYYIIGSLQSTVKIGNVYEATIFLAQTTLRSVVGSKSLNEVLTSREMLSQEVRIACERASAGWGVRIERVAIKDINLPDILHRAMAAEAEALREARAKVISAEGDLNASKALKEASDVMAKNKIALQLRHLQILKSISKERGLDILYPFPLEMLTGFTDAAAGDSSKPKKDAPKEPSVPLKESVISIVTNVLEPFMRNPTELLEGESFRGTHDANQSITADFPQSDANSQGRINVQPPDEPPQSSNSEPHGKFRSSGTQTEPKTGK